MLDWELPMSGPRLDSPPAAARHYMSGEFRADSPPSGSLMHHYFDTPSPILGFRPSSVARRNAGSRSEVGAMNLTVNRSCSLSIPEGTGKEWVLSDKRSNLTRENAEGCFMKPGYMGQKCMSGDLHRPPKHVWPKDVELPPVGSVASMKSVVEVDITGRWTYESGSYEIRESEGKWMLFQDGHQGEFFVDGDWLLATMATPSGEVAGTVRLRYDSKSERLLSNFKPVRKGWRNDTWAIRESLEMYEVIL